MRVALYTDYVYRREHGVLYGERAFALFVGAIAERVDQLSVIGRLTDQPGPTRYALPAKVRMEPLPHYQSLTHPGAVVASLLRSLQRMRRALQGVDVVWVLGPYPHAILLVLLALIRRQPVVLGVRQDWPEYVRTRRPGRRWLHLAADVLEWIWRRFARRLPVVAVGPELASRYAFAPSVLELAVSLVPEAALAAGRDERRSDGTLTALSVGRLDEEKNPLLLADILALLREHDDRWELSICGEGDLANALVARVEHLGIDQHAHLLGYVPMGDGLLDLYRRSHAFLHVSWTEGFPQVLVEAFACGLPVVATAVGGVPAGVGDAALLIPPGDAPAAAAALNRIGREPALRDRLSAAGRERARDQTLESQTQRVVDFLGEQVDRHRASRR